MPFSTKNWKQSLFEIRDVGAIYERGPRLPGWKNENKKDLPIMGSSLSTAVLMTSARH